MWTLAAARTVRARLWVGLMFLLHRATAPIPVAAQDPTPEGHDAVMAALAETGQGMSTERLNRIAGPWAASPSGLVWWRSRITGTGDRAGELRARGGGAGLAADGRFWRWTDGSTGRAGWVLWQGRRGGVLVGGWGWRTGFGLVAGGAGRRAGLTADAGLGPGGRGLQRWGRAPEKGTVVGAAVAGPVGPLVGTVAAGRVDEAPVRVYSLAVADRSWELMLVEGPGGGLTAGLSNRWRRGAWLGGWEISVPPVDHGEFVPAAICGIGWRGPGRLAVDALAASVPGALSSVLASPIPLVGRAGGRGWALRGSGRFSGGPRVAVLLSRSLRRDRSPNPETRNLTEVIVAGRAGAGLAWELTWRLDRRARSVWRDGWPWLPPEQVQGLRRASLGLTVEREQGPLHWRCGIRSLAVDGSATVGRRTLLSVQGNGFRGRLVTWRGGYTLAWGDPVDLVSVLVPAPGRVVARHWGHWRSETWLGLGVHHGPWRLAGSVHRREAVEEAAVLLEWRLEAGAVR